MNMMMSKDELFSIGEKLLEEFKKYVDDCALLLTSSVKHQVRFANNIITVTKTWIENTLHACVDKSNRVAVFSIPLEKALKNPELAPKMALGMLKHANPREDYAPFPEPAKELPTIEHFDKTVIEKPEKGIELVIKTIDDFKSEGIKRVAGTMRLDAISSALLTTKGAEFFDLRTQVYLDVRTFMNGEITGAFSSASSHTDSLDIKSVIDIASYLAKASTEAKSIEPGKYTTIFTPMAFGALSNFIGFASSAYAVILGYSFFVNKLNQKVASDIVTILDNPHLRRGFNSTPFDLEGVSTSKKPIIEKGNLKNYLHNRFTAKRMNAKLTGNAGWIFPSPWQLDILPGDSTFDEMLSEVRDGILVGNCTYIRLQNYVLGQFSCVIRDGVFYVKNGEIKFRVKGLRLADSFPNILSNVRLLSKDRFHMYSWWFETDLSVSSPWVLVEKANFTKAFGF